MGFIYSRAQSFAPDIDSAVPARFKRAAKFGLVPFVLAIVIAGMVLADLTSPAVSLARTVLVLVWIELVVLLAYGVVSVLFYLD